MNNYQLDRKSLYIIHHILLHPVARFAVITLQLFLFNYALNRTIQELYQVRFLSI